MSRSKVCLSETVARQRRAAQFLKNQAARARRKALAALRTTHASHDPVGMASNAAASSPGLTASAAHRIAATADLMALSRDRERLSNLLKNAAASVGAEAARAAAERAARAAAARAKAEAASAEAALETKRVAAAVATAQLTMQIGARAWRCTAPIASCGTQARPLWTSIRRRMWRRCVG